MSGALTVIAVTQRAIQSWQEIISDDLCWQETTASWPARTPNLTNDLSMCRKLFRRSVLILGNLSLFYDLHGPWHFIFFPFGLSTERPPASDSCIPSLTEDTAFSKHWKKKKNRKREVQTGNTSVVLLRPIKTTEVWQRQRKKRLITRDAWLYSI